MLVFSLLLMSALGVQAQSVSTDKNDYAPGELAIISGAGWLNDEYVDIDIAEEPAYDHNHDFHNTKVNEDGTFRIEFPIEDRHLGVSFTVVVKGQSSGVTATTIFTDAPNLISMNPSSGPASGGTEITLTGKGLFVNGWELVVTVGNLAAVEKPNSRTTSGNGTNQVQSLVVYSPAQAGGDYDVKAVLTKTTGQQQTEVSNAFTFNYLKATASMSMSNVLQTYDGAAKPVVVTTSPAGLTGINVTYNGSPSVPTSVGTYQVLATLDNPSYQAAPVYGTLVIQKATANISLSNLQHTYNGAPKSATVSSNASGSSIYTITYDGAVEVPVNHKAGGYAVVVTLENDNYAGSATGTLFIDKAEQVISWANPSAITYGTPLSAAQLNASLTQGDGNLLYSPVAGEVLNAGNNQTLYVTASETNNYKFTKAAVSLDVAKATPSVVLTVGGPHTYDGQPKYASSATVIGINGISMGNAIVSYKKDGNTVAVPVGAGTYDVVASFEGSANYTQAQAAGILVINRAQMVIKASDAHRIYGDANPSFNAYVESGAVPGESFSLSASTVATMLSDVGLYSIIPTITGETLSNYDMLAVSGLLTINERPVTVKVAAGQMKVYGDPDPALTYNVTVGQVVNNDSFSGSLSRAAGESVGQYAIYQNTLSLGLNYVITFEGDNLTISPAPLTVTAHNASRLCGQENPALTGSISGLKFADLIAASYSTVADNNSAVGVYAIVPTPSGDALANYTVTKVNGELTVAGVQLDASTNAAPQALKNTTTEVRINVLNTNGGAAANVLVTLYFDGNAAVQAMSNASGVASFNVGVLGTGVYKVRAIAGSGCDETVVYLPVYDPDGGFVTGGGWINSPKGAYKANPELTGKANFGFVAKYKKGSNIPDGNTEFQFQAGNLNFNSSAYDEMRLVISGAKASYKGVGQINGAGKYGFMVSAIDGDVNGGGGQDKFRIKIWTFGNDSDVIYDNNITSTDENADPATVIGGGSIVIHENKSIAGGSSMKKTIASETKLLTEPSRFLNYPNPYNDRTIIAFSFEKEEGFELGVHDVKGALVMKYAVGVAEKGKVYEYEFSAGNLPEGIYFARLVTSSGVKAIKMVLKR